MCLFRGSINRKKPEQFSFKGRPCVVRCGSFHLPQWGGGCFLYHNFVIAIPNGEPSFFEK